MTPTQLDLARWLAGSDAWRVWCEEHPFERIASMYLPDLGMTHDMRPEPFARFWLRFNDVYAPRLDTSRMVGPLLEMLHACVGDGLEAHIALDCGAWTVSVAGPADEWREHGCTVAEALCALLREVAG